MSTGASRNGPRVAVEHRRRRSTGRRSAAGTSTRRCRSAPRARRPRSPRGTRSPRSAERGFRPGGRRRRRGAWCATLACPHGHDEHCDRSSTATERRRGQGPRLDALRGRPPGPRPAARAAGARRRGARADRAASTASAALDVPGVVAVLTAADLPFVDGAAGRAGQPLAREEIVYSGPAGGAGRGRDRGRGGRRRRRRSSSTSSRSRPALDLEAAMAPGAARARVDVVEGDGADVGGAHAAAGGGDAGADDEELSDNVAGRQRMAAGDAAAALAGGAARAAGRFSTSWIHQGYLEPQVATAWLEPEGGLVVSSSTQGAFSTRQQLADLLGWSHDRVRVRPAPLGGAFGGKLMIAEPLGGGRAACASSARCAWRSRACEDFAAVQPGARRAPRARGRRHGRGRADRRPRAHRARSRQQRRVRLRGARRAARVGPVPLAGARRRRPTACSPTASASAPTARRRRRRRPSRSRRWSTSWPSELGLDPIELRLRNVLREGDQGLDGKPFPVFGAAECLERLRAHPLWERRGDAARRRGRRRRRSAGGPAGSSPRPRAAGWTPTAS